MPYVHPPQPPPLNIPPTTSVHSDIRLKEDHREAVRLFKETINVEGALKAQIVEAIDSLYIKTLKNAHTMKIYQSIPDILTFLFQRYG